MTPLDLFLQHAAPKIVERIDLPARPERRLPSPPPYRDGATGEWLAAMLGQRDTVWRHQALALTAIAKRQHIVISTATASGKSLVFQTPVLHELLDGDGVALVLYPQKALGGDQLARWRHALQLADLPTTLVGEINGDVGMSERMHVLETARVILATPDVIHAWMMRQVAAPAIARFVAQLRFLVIDEAHALEGAFGSNCVYLFRRLRCAHHRLRLLAGHGGEIIQIIAATATIADPAGHLEALTGCTFNSITEADNGAPSAGQTLLHIEGPAHGDPAEAMLAEILTGLAEVIAPHAFIAFADSRQGVERVARRIKRNDVLPYRSGFEGRDRRAIETALRAGELRGTVSTSALELGIDIPQFTIGLNLGIPQSKKAFRQRIGRVGRATSGVFVVIAPAHSFAQLGSSFRAFYEGSVEASHLYSENEIIQFAQARCLIEECDVVADGSTPLPDSVTWPAGFDRIFAYAQPNALRPRDLDAVAALGGDSPHHSYPIRHICEVGFTLRDERDPNNSIGSIDLAKAIREAYPGAIYYHFGSAYRVVEWRNRPYERSIRLQRIRNFSPNKPLLHTMINVSLDSGDLIQGHLLAGYQAQFAELNLRVTESVEGFRYGSTAVRYSELRTEDPRLGRKRREISTTGLLLRIEEPWFAGKEKHQLSARRAVAHALQTLLMREYSIAPGDLAYAHSNIALCSFVGVNKLDDAIVIYDNVIGGLRLSAPLFDEIGAFIARLVSAAEMAGVDALISGDMAARLAVWHDRLTATPAPLAVIPDASADEHLIFAPNSEVGIRSRGILFERKLIAPQIVTLGDDDVLMYRYESSPGVVALVPHHQVEPIGQNWQRALWTPSSDLIREIKA